MKRDLFAWLTLATEVNFIIIKIFQNMVNQQHQKGHPLWFSLGLVILYFSILFDVLTKHDDMRKHTLKSDFHLTCYNSGSLISVAIDRSCLFVQLL